MVLWLPAVFSDNALFQHSAGLTIHGKASAGATIEVRLCREETEICCKVAEADEKGRFEVSFKTPPASFLPYRCSVSDGEETLVFKNWLFGELWLAAGQSNMEISVGCMPDQERFEEAARGKTIRFYYQEYGDQQVFPEEPEDTVGGLWCTVDEESFSKISACGAVAVSEIYTFLNQSGNDVPVGLVNSSMGATFIEGWLPREAVEKDEDLVAYLVKNHGHLPFGRPWNGYGGDNYRQAYAWFNRKIAALIGIQLRGIFWYQGESNVGGRQEKDHYRRALLLYQQVYEGLFLADGCDVLPVVCVQLYAFLNNGWYISEETECRLGYFNEAYIEAAQQRPEAFSVVPIYDLPPRFAPYTKKVYPHPVHPMHKFELGQRLGKVALAKVYGGPGAKTAAALLKTEATTDGALVLSFETDGNPLVCTDGGPRGFYICGEKGIYQEAEALIVDKDKLRLSHPFIPLPRYAAYRYEDMALGESLYCGGLPVAAFASDRMGKIFIAPKPWLHTDIDASIIQYEINDAVPRMDFFYHPLWHPTDDSELCRDDVYCKTRAALRIRGDGDFIGAFVRSYPGNPLDLQNYRALRVSVFHYEGAVLTIQAEKVDEEGKIALLTFPMVEQPEDENGWTDFEADLRVPGIGKAERLLFRFDVSKKKLPAVNIDGLQLIAFS